MTINKRYGLVGASYIAVYEFGPKIRGASALNYGQSGDPNSPHYFDQARLLSECKLKPELFDWADVLAGAKTVYHPGEPPVEHVAK
jgi:acyl-homoserine-lactone acylase